MFLNQLSLSERTAFINLSILAARANETISEREYLILEDYCKETGVVFVDTATIPSIGEIYGVFSKSETRIKKIVLFEILNLLYADGTFDVLEEEFLNNFAAAVGLTEEDVNKMIDLVWKYLDVINGIADAIK